MCSACVAVEITKKPNESALCSGVAEGTGGPKSKVQSPTSKVIAATVLPQDRTERSEAQDQGAESRGQKSDDRSPFVFFVYFVVPLSQFRREPFLRHFSSFNSAVPFVFKGFCGTGNQPVHAGMIFCLVTSDLSSASVPLAGAHDWTKLRLNKTHTFRNLAGNLCGVGAR